MLFQIITIRTQLEARPHPSDAGCLMDGRLRLSDWFKWCRWKGEIDTITTNHPCHAQALIVASMQQLKQKKRFAIQTDRLTDQVSDLPSYTDLSLRADAGALWITG